MARLWRPVGFTFYNDPPPGAGDLRWGGYSFAELGTATRGGIATGTGNLAKAMGYPGEVPMGTPFTFATRDRVVVARKQDRGYGQGGDGVHSDPHYMVDLYDGHAYGLPNLVAALGVGGSGTIWAMWGPWHVGEENPPQMAAMPAPISGAVQAGTVPAGAPQHDYHVKVHNTGKSAGEHGSSVQRVNVALSAIPGRYRA